MNLSGGTSVRQNYKQGDEAGPRRLTKQDKDVDNLSDTRRCCDTFYLITVKSVFTKQHLYTSISSEVNEQLFLTLLNYTAYLICNTI